MAKSKRYRTVVDQMGNRQDINVLDAIEVAKKYTEKIDWVWIDCFNNYCNRCCSLSITANQLNYKLIKL